MTAPDLSPEAVERLAVWVGSLAHPAGLQNDTAATLRALSAALAAREAEGARLREALEDIAAMDGNPYPADDPSFGEGYDLAASSAADTARAALEGGGDG